MLDLMRLAGPRRRPSDLGAPTATSGAGSGGDKERWYEVGPQSRPMEIAEPACYTLVFPAQ